MVNWSYFSANRDWTYDAVQKLVNSGLAGPVIFNVKPMTRREMARIVLNVVDRIRSDADNNHNDRKDMEDLLMSLVEEFKPELRDLGFTHAIGEGPKPGFFTYQPIDKVQVRTMYAGASSRLENQQGETFRDGGNLRTAFNGWAEADGFAAAYAHPEFYGSSQDRRARLVEGYVRASYANVQLTVGREAMWWGPGYHGSTLMSNNAQAPWKVQLDSQEAFYFPWVFRSMGPFKVNFYVMRMDKNQTFPNAYETGMRLSFAPASFMEVGISRDVTFGGRGKHPAVQPWMFPRIAFTIGDAPDPLSPYRTGFRGSIDATFRFHDVDRYLPVRLTRDVELYGDLQIDDTQNLGVLPIKPRQPGYMLGIFLPNFLGTSLADLRVEYAYGSGISWADLVYTSGFQYKGFPLAHFIGTGGRDLYVRASHWVNERIQVASELGYSTIHTVDYSQSTDCVGCPKMAQKMRYGGVDVSYAYAKDLRFRLGFQMRHATNLEFAPGRNRTFPVFRFETTYSFGSAN